MPHKDPDARRKYYTEKMKRNIENKRYQCGRCERTFRDASRLRNHGKVCASNDITRTIIPGDEHIDKAPVTMHIPGEEEGEMEELKRIAMKYGWL
jgi:hypothetical protein